MRAALVDALLGLLACGKYGCKPLGRITDGKWLNARGTRR